MSCLPQRHQLKKDTVVEQDSRNAAITTFEFAHDSCHVETNSSFAFMELLQSQSNLCSQHTLERNLFHSNHVNRCSLVGKERSRLPVTNKKKIVFTLFFFRTTTITHIPMKEDPTMTSLDVFSTEPKISAASDGTRRQKMLRKLDPGHDKVPAFNERLII